MAYDVRIRNRGQRAATQVVFRSTLDGNTRLYPDSLVVGGTAEQTVNLQAIEVDLGTIPADAVVSVVFEVTVSSEMSSSVGQIVNQGMIISAELPTIVTDDPDTERTGDATITLLQRKPQLDVHKRDKLFRDADGSGTASIGDEIEYEITVTNLGNATATALRLLDRLDENLTFMVDSLSSTHGAMAVIDIGNSQQIGIQIGNLAAGATALVRFRAIITAPKTENVTRIVNQALVGGTNVPLTYSDDPDTDVDHDPTVTILAHRPILSAFMRDQLIVDTDANGEPSAGDVLLYQVTIRNSGSATATMLAYEDLVDPNTTLVPTSIQTNQGNVITNNNPALGLVQVAVDSLPPGEQINISYQTIIHPSIGQDVAKIENQGILDYQGGVAILTDDPDTPARQDSTRTTIAATAHLEASKTDFVVIDADNNGYPSPGDTLLYQVKLVNQGNGSAQHLFFSDTPDANTMLMNGTVTTTLGTVNTGNGPQEKSILVEIEELAAGDTVWISYQVRINNPLPQDVDRIYNQGHFWADGIPTTKTNDPETLLVNDITGTIIGSNAAIQVYLHALRIDGAQNRLLYQATIENNSHLPAQEVVYQDPLTANARLDVTSVRSSQGRISNNRDSNPGLRIEVGDIPAGERVRISYAVSITERQRDDVTVVSAQGNASSHNQPQVLSDDPTTVDINDPTITILPAPPRVLLPHVVAQKEPIPTPTATPTATPTVASAPTPNPVMHSCPAQGCDVRGLERPQRIAVHTASNSLFVTNRDSDQLLRIDATTLDVTAAVPTGDEPWGVVVDDTPARVYIVNHGSGDVWIYDLATLALITQIDVGHQPTEAAILPDLDTVAVSVTGENKVAVIEGIELNRKLESGGEKPTALAAMPYHAAFAVVNEESGNGRVLYHEVGNWRNDGPTLSIGTLSDKAVPSSVAFHPQKNRLYIRYNSSDGWFIDIFQFPAEAVMPVQRRGRIAADGDGTLAYNPISSHLLATNRASGSLSIIDGASDLLLNTVEMGIDPAAVAIHPQSGAAYILLSAVNRLQIFADMPMAGAASIAGIAEGMERFYLPQINSAGSKR